MQIRMHYAMSGGRHDSRPWPPAGVPFEVPDWEGFDLIRGENAVPHDEAARQRYDEITRGGAEAYAAACRDYVPPETEQPAPPRPVVTEPVPEPVAVPVAPPEVSLLAEVSPLAEVSGPPANPEPGPEPEQVTEASPASPPAPSAPKQAWIDYAVDCGADVHEASVMTKVDLMSRYGGRL